MGAVAVIATARTAGAQVTVGAEYDRDRFTYHFDNPSTFDTAEPVPHFFEQRYDADNLWIVATARYRAGIAFETTAGVTPTRSTTAEDYDTFVDPGATIVAGTTGAAMIGSWRIEQRAEVARAAAAVFSAGYRLRVDTTDFGVGENRVVRNGVLVSSAVVTSPEHTLSQMHEVFVGATARGFAAEIAPATLGRLLVQLPEKYPGQDLVFTAKVATGSVSFMLTRSRFTIGVRAQHAWSYSSAAALHRTILAVGGGVRL